MPYHPKRTPAGLLRLLGSTQKVLESLNAGHFSATEGPEAEEACAVSDALALALSEAVAALPSQVSPFLLFRREIMGESDVSAMIRDLVLHLRNCNNPCNLGRLLAACDLHHTEVVMDLIESFSRNGERDDAFMDVVAEVLQKCHAESAKEVAL